MKRFIVLLTVIASFSLGGCESTGWFNDMSKSFLPITEDGALKMFAPISNSPKAPCTMQREVAKHNSIYDTAKERKLVTYKAPCDADPKAQKAKPPEKAAAPVS